MGILWGRAKGAGAAKRRTTLRVNFVLPAYFDFPIGGYRVVYEYANVLAARGHRVTIVFPRHVPGADHPRGRLDPLRDQLWTIRTRLRNRPLVPWYDLDRRVALALVPSLRRSTIPSADVTVATAWQTAEPVAALTASKGAKFYLIQSYETWDGPKDRVDATWRMPMRKVVISNWLAELGASMRVHHLRHIPNGIDTRHFRVITPPETRPVSVVSIYHSATVKGVPDAIAVLERFHERFPEAPVSMFGMPPRGQDVPAWVNYFRDPAQEILVRDIYNGHAVYLGASLLEGWALPPAEAMACGCAFVGTDIGGFRDYATHGETALLSPPGDRDALLHNLCEIADNPALRRRIQQSGTERIREFTWERSGIALERYFLEAISHPPLS